MPRGRGRGSNRINRRCPVHNSFVGRDGICARCEEGEQEQRDEVTATVVNDVSSPNPPDAPNDEEMRDVEMVVTEMCDKCCRISTDNYKLDFQSVQGDSTHRTMFGGQCVQERVQLCQQCVNYNNSTARRKDWPNAWPSVLYTFLFDFHRFSSNTEKLFKLLPLEIKNSYMHYMKTIHPLIALRANTIYFSARCIPRNLFFSELQYD